MGSYTDLTRRWLDRRFRFERDGIYIPHQPIYGLNNPNQQAVHVPIFARTLQVLRLLNHVSFDTMLDIGGGEGFLARLTKDLFDARVVSSDLSVEACLRAKQILGIDSVALNSARLPFPDDAFDVVVCSEVVEHVEYPVETLLEVARVARRAFVVTTDEIWFDEAERDRELFERCGLPHLETCMFVPSDFDALYGTDGLRWLHFRGHPPQEPIEREAAIDWIEEAVRDPELSPDAEGIAVLHMLDPEAKRSAPLAQREMLQRMLDTTVPECAAGGGAWHDSNELAPLIRERLVDPKGHGALRDEDGALRTDDGRRYEVVHGVPDFFAPAEGVVASSEFADRVARSFASEPDRQQALIALREKLVLPDVAGCSAFDFANEEHHRGFKRNDELVERDGPGTAMHLTSTGGDPWIVTPRVEVDLAELEAVEIRMRLHNPDFDREGGLGQLFWYSEGDRTFAEERSVFFPVWNDREVHTYEIAVDAAPWPESGTILNFRIDPANGPCEIDLFSFCLRMK